MTITLRNEFHEREIDVKVPSLPHTLTPSQVGRARRELCGHADCQCQLIASAWRSQGKISSAGFSASLGRKRLGCYPDGDSEGRASWTIEEAR